MSALIRGVRKIFKKVTKVVRKVSPGVLAAAAIVYTGGAMAGASWAEGGWGAATKNLMEGIGLKSGMLSDVLSTSLTHAGYGAALGGVIGGTKGMETGALTGAVTGGLAGGFGKTGDVIGDAASKFGAPSEAASNLPGTAQSAPGETDLLASAGGTGPAPDVLPSPTNDLLSPANMPAGQAMPAVLQRKTGLVPTNPPKTGLWNSIKDSSMAGQAIGGIGGALLSGDDKDRTNAAKIDAEAEAAARTRQAGNYANPQGLLTADQMTYLQNQQPRPTPEQRFDPGTYGGRYVYDTAAKKVVFVPNAAA